MFDDTSVANRALRLPEILDIILSSLLPEGADEDERDTAVDLVIGRAALRAAVLVDRK
jgi:hypothetical protein